MDQPNRQPSPFFINRIDRDLGAIEPEFFRFTEEAEAWTKVHEYLRIVRKRSILIVAVTLLVIAFVAARDLSTPSLYTATATLLINNNVPSLFVDQGGTVSSQADFSGYDSDDQTEYQLLRSRGVGARVILAEGLLKPAANQSTSPTFTGEIKRWLKSWLPFSRPAKKAAEQLGDLGVPSGAIDAYLGQIQISPIENTHMVRVSATTADPELSARLANAHSEQFIRRGIELNAQATDDAGKFLAGKLAELKDQLEKSELALNNYRRDKGIIPGLISVDGKDDVVLERLNKISGDLQDAHLKTISLGTEVELTKQGRSDALSGVIENSLIQKLKGDLDALQVEKAAMAHQFKSNYPPMQQLQARIQGTQAALNLELQNATSNIHEQYQVALEREKTLSRELDKEKSFVLGLNDSAVRYLLLQREADTNRELYNSVLKHMKDMALIGDVHASNISIVDRAETPGAPTSPRTRKDITQAIFLGLALALGIAFVLDRLDATLKFPDEAQRYLQIPSLALIPDFNLARGATAYGGRASHNGGALRASFGLSIPQGSPKLNGARHTGDIVTLSGKYSILSEAYRNLRTALLLSRPGAHPKITLITSAVPNEGKTTVAVNTSIVLAQTGAKVLLIDADLRKPRCHKVLSLKNHYGLTELLTGLANDDVISATQFENLRLLSSGRIPPSPSELLGSSRMRELLENLSKIYDYIVVDSPPVMVVADSIVLSTMADGVVIVAAGGQTPRQQIRAAVARLHQANARIFGFVLNKLHISKSDYPYYHHKGFYSESYGDYFEDSDHMDHEEGPPNRITT